MAGFSFGDCTGLAASWLWAGTLPLDQTRLALAALVLAGLPGALVYAARRMRLRAVALAVSGASVAFVVVALVVLEVSCVGAANEPIATGVAGSEGASRDNDGAIRLHALVLGAGLVIGWVVLLAQFLAWVTPAPRRLRPSR